MNLADSERMAGVLEDIGYMNTEDPGSADVIIYNTCSIRDKAEQKVYSALGRQVCKVPCHFLCSPVEANLCAQFRSLDVCLHPYNIEPINP